MNWRINILLFLIVLTSCKQEVKIDEPTQTSPLIEFSEFSEIFKNSTVKVIDFRRPSDYQKEHITGALNIWRTDIENSSYPYGGMMASTKQVEELFSRLGIKNNDTLIIYDDNGLVDSARLWWVLQNYDYENVRLLHGGFSAWKSNSGAVTDKETLIKASSFKLTEKPSLKYLITKDEVLKELDSNTVILDTRSTDEFSGKAQKNGAFKGGRIPKSKLIDWAAAIDYNGTKKMKSLEDLKNIYGELTASKEGKIIVYCHSGVRSAHTTFVLTQLLGYKNIKNYDGSWTEWSYFDELPFEKDDLTN